MSLDVQASVEETEDIITFRFSNPQREFWDFILSWVGDSTEENREIIERKVIKVTPLYN